MMYRLLSKPWFSGVAGTVLGGVLVAVITSINLPALFKDVREDLVPAGAVVAFDIRERCPDGWADFDDAAGRVVIGAGQSDGGTKHSFAETGGAEQVILKVSNLPPHVHGMGTRVIQVQGGTTYNVRQLDGPDNWDTKPGPVNASGGVSPVSTMPPFVALRYCKKM